MTPKVIMHVVGARPNFVKVAPVVRALERQRPGLPQSIVHTGQHYDANMSRVFFQDLDIPDPDINLGVGSGPQGWQTGQIMVRLEQVLKEHEPRWLFVYGDTNSTMAAALVAAKLETRVAHVEAGLRSFDRSMPEEINRVVTDHVSDLLFTPSRDADANLEREGVPGERVYFVGNVMIDTLVSCLAKAQDRSVLGRLGLSKGGTVEPYLLVTLHRPSNVDHPPVLAGIMEALVEASHRVKVVFPVHPRTRRRISELVKAPPGLVLTEPVGYLDFICLEKHAALVVTDSGGIQEETTYLQVPCLTVRHNTERPVTITHGTNRLVPPERKALTAAVAEVLDHGPRPAPGPPELWDGKASLRIAQIMESLTS